MATDIYDHPTEVLNWFGERCGEMFFEQVRAWLESALKNLEKETAPEELYRLQGEIGAYRSILEIPEEVKRFQRDKKDGRIK